MKLSQIISKEYYRGKVFWDIVFEWEDVFQKELNLKKVPDTALPIIGNFVYRFPSLARLFPPYSTSLSFELGPWKEVVGRNKPNIVPWIIDFFIKDPNKLICFYKEYSEHKVVLVSNPEVLDFLKENDCPFRVEHLGLSLPDKYRISPDTKFKKNYDIVILGRPNPVLNEYLSIFKNDHPNTSIVTSKKVGNDYICYDDKGLIVGKANTRDEYWSILRQARCALYSTPGIDGGEARTNGYNQVTPKFLEEIACGCNVVCRYKQNADTDYYEMGKYWANIDSYEEFSKEFEKAISVEADMEFASKYLSKHYTSVRANQLTELLRNID